MNEGVTLANSLINSECLGFVILFEVSGNLIIWNGYCFYLFYYVINILKLLSDALCKKRK